MRTSTNIRDSSLLAFRAIEPTLEKREQEIIRFLARNAHRDFTRLEIATESGISLQSVCGRINRLLKIGALEELPIRKCKYGKSGCPVRLLPSQMGLFERRQSSSVTRRFITAIASKYCRRCRRWTR